MSKYVFLLVFCFMGNFLFAPAKAAIHAEAGSTPIKKIVKEIAKSNVYETANTDANSQTSSLQNARYQQLLKTATTQQLINLARENKNAIVRLYAFRALVNNLKEVPVEIVEKFRNDATLIEVKHGDAIEKKPLHTIASGFLY